MQRVLILHPHFKTLPALSRNNESQLEEAVGLAHAIDLEVADKRVVNVTLPRPSTLFGKGKVEELGTLAEGLEVDLVVINSHLSPVQQRNLERAWECKVIDRTALILEIFGARAATQEGKLQVELAALNYQKTRLVRSWTHLERQRGGFGFLGGPGESQIELDRRMIRDRIAKLKKQLEQVVRTRELHRKKRKSVPYPIIALVGYTNAGKSTLFNYLTGAGVVAMDKLFATLDPTMRAIKLPSGSTVILSDTVGFVSDLPHELIAAFRATLEEVLEADIMLHIRDISHPETREQKKDVEEVLCQLFNTKTLPDNVLEVHNKIDCLNEEEREALQPGTPAISAITGEGVDMLLALLDEKIKKHFYSEATFCLPASEGKAIAWLHRNGNILSQTLEDDTLNISVSLTQENLHRFEKQFEFAALHEKTGT